MVVKKPKRAVKAKTVRILYEHIGQKNKGRKIICFLKSKKLDLSENIAKKRKKIENAWG